MKLIKYLLDWTVAFARNKDLILKKIKNIEIKKEVVYIEYKDRQVEYIIRPTLDQSHWDDISDNTHVVTLNNRKNVDFLLTNWDIAVKYPTLNFIFVNPFSAESKWIICPFIHDRICDPDSLQLGVYSMAEGVLDITEEEAEKKITGAMLFEKSI